MGITKGKLRHWWESRPGSGPRSGRRPARFHLGDWNPDEREHSWQVVMSLAGPWQMRTTSDFLPAPLKLSEDNSDGALSSLSPMTRDIIDRGEAAYSTINLISKKDR